MLDALRIAPGTSPGLDRRATRDTLGLADKAEGRVRLRELGAELSELQERLWAEGARALLLVLQGMDTSGKDGTIRGVFRAVNPQGLRVVSFRKPSEVELSHDYLWRVHGAAPRRGEIGVFNRSHYEDVGVVRVLDLVDEARWRRRYEHIRAFERLLTDEGTVVRKVWLHISAEEQRERLQARLDEPHKHWKFNVADLDARRAWHRYQAAYEEAIAETSTAEAPWYVVPADRKWVRDVAVATLLADTLRAMDPQPPPPVAELAGVAIPEPDAT
ncbi:MAG: polyphosphate kinase 2 family protein [Actinomycetes bacterium]